MTPREIIAKAWSITKKENQLWRWGFASALFETLRNVQMLLYQSYYFYWFAQGETVGWYSVEMIFFEFLPLWLFIGITAILIITFIMELFVPTLATGAIIGLSAKSYNKEEVKGGLVLALFNFFPILEIHGLFVLSSVATTLTAASLILRYGQGSGMVGFAIGVLIFLWIFSTIFRFFASFSEEEVVIRRTGAFHAIGRSFKLVISHLSHMVFILILLFVISLRILINAVMILLIPAIAFGLGWLLTFFLSPTLSYGIGAIFGGIMLIGASYFFAYLTVFKQTVWTLTYIELSKQKDLDVIDVDDGDDDYDEE